MIYRLVTFGEPVALTLTTAQSSEKKTALKELKDWADRNGHIIATHANDSEATCVVQQLEII